MVGLGLEGLSDVDARSIQVACSPSEFAVISRVRELGRGRAREE